MQEFTYEQIREKALRQGVKDNRVHIGLWANINNYLKIRRKKNGKVTTYYISLQNWLTEKIRFKVQRLILSNLLGVLIPFLPCA